MVKPVKHQLPLSKYCSVTRSDVVDLVWRGVQQEVWRVVRLGIRRAVWLWAEGEQPRHDQIN